MQWVGALILIFLLSVKPEEIQNYWNVEKPDPWVSSHMSYHEFMSFNSCLELSEDYCATLLNRRLRRLIHSGLVLVIDESMCKCSKRHQPDRVMMPLKPIRNGFKWWVLGGDLVRELDREDLQVTEPLGPSQKQNDAKSVAKRISSALSVFMFHKNQPRSSSMQNVVTELVDDIINNEERKEPHIVVFDSGFTTFGLIQELSKRGVACVGKCAPNRVKAVFDYLDQVCPNDGAMTLVSVASPCICHSE